jgi:maltooligosyltrehalose trehalohydrolase
MALRLRLDAAHGILDDSPKHILQEIAEAAHAEGALVVAESDLNDPRLVDRYGLDACWADDLHHALQVALTGESQGYYRDYQKTFEAIIESLRSGWYYQGQFKPSFGRKHGMPAAHLPGRRFVVCAQNHDQIGNRARGERLTALTDAGGLRVAAALIALQPSLPLYFQGEEWAAKEPFLYFTSYGDKALAEAVRQGRREEFKQFAWQGEVPDPQEEETLLRSKIDRARKDPAALAWHRALLKLRREHPSLQDDARSSLRAWSEGRVLFLQRQDILLVASFSEAAFLLEVPAGRWRVLLDSGKARLEGRKLRGEGRHAVVLERA